MTTTAFPNKEDPPIKNGGTSPTQLANSSFSSLTSGNGDNGEEVKFYAADGKFIGQTVATDGTASYAASEALVIAKVGYGSIKIVVK